MQVHVVHEHGIHIHAKAVMNHIIMLNCKMPITCMYMNVQFYFILLGVHVHYGKMTQLQTDWDMIT